MVLEAVISIIFLLLVGFVSIFHLIHIKFRPKLRTHRIFVWIVVIFVLVLVRVFIIRHGHSPPYALLCARNGVLIVGNFCNNKMIALQPYLFVIVKIY